MAEAALWRPPTNTAPTRASSAAQPDRPKARTGHRRVGGGGVVGAGGAVTPRATAHDPAKRRGSNALFPRTSSALPPSDSASSMSALRSAAISLAMGSGTPSLRHSRRHSSMNSLMPVPPVRPGPGRHQRRLVLSAILAFLPQARLRQPARGCSTSEVARRCWLLAGFPLIRHAPDGPRGDRWNLLRRLRAPVPANVSSSRSHRPVLRSSRPGGKCRERPGAAGSVDRLPLPCVTR
jgi:hypothetical protein